MESFHARQNVRLREKSNPSPLLKLVTAQPRQRHGARASRYSLCLEVPARNATSARVCVGRIAGFLPAVRDRISQHLFRARLVRETFSPRNLRELSLCAAPSVSFDIEEHRHGDACAKTVWIYPH